MTVFALHPEAIIQGQLLRRPWLLTSTPRNMATQVPYHITMLSIPQRV